MKKYRKPSIWKSMFRNCWNLSYDVESPYRKISKIPVIRITESYPAWETAVEALRVLYTVPEFKARLKKKGRKCLS